MNNLSKKTFNASLWVIFGYGFSQVIRLGGNLVLTRLLEPELFGIMAIVWVVLNGVEMLSNIGLIPSVVRSSETAPSRFHDTVWTMKVIRGWLLFFIINIVALYIYSQQVYSNVSPDSVYAFAVLPWVLAVVSVVPLLEGYGTLAVAIHTKNLNHKKLELMNISSKLLGMVAMISLAFYSPTIWSLVVGSLIASLSLLILTYSLFDIRHSHLLDKTIVRDVYNFGKWIFIASTLTYLVQQGDKLYFSTIITPAELGVYSIAYMIINVFHSVLETLATKIWYPYFCNKVDDKDSFKSSYYRVKILNQISVFIVAIVLFVLGQPIIDFLYDERYMAAGMMIKVLLISLMGVSITGVSRVCLTAMGETKVQVQSMFIRGVVLVITLPLLFNIFGFIGAILAYALNIYFSIPIQLFWLKQAKILSFRGEALSFFIIISFGCVLYLLNPDFWLVILGSM